VTTPLSRTTCRPYAGTCYDQVQPHTKFEVSMFTHYEDMKGNAKCRNWGGLGLGFTQGQRQCHHLIEHLAYDCVFNSNKNYASVLYHFRVMVLGAPVGGDPFEFRRGLWHKKTRVPGRCLRDPQLSRFDTIPACDRRTHTDRQTDTITQRRRIPR